ncbi:TIGR03435 family protein [Terriglobus albidus]|uniref:TIGR03435 family protein n=1 Tax=Terriglobus albidus TaxID=1592106 RepID=A0A5B9EJW3_9BACT|nr:TIGR03435 family protein [Terriglobus albidus]QEE30356.1 TIGR03435 family protein [Terriglobus albidus]
MRRLLLLRFIVVLIAPAYLAQSSAQNPSSMMAPHKLEFEVASVRENKSGGRGTSNFPLDRGDVYFPTGGVFSATNQSLVTLLIFAYKINISEFRGGLMRRLPSWATTDKFDINARAESGKPTKEDMRLMLQSLLEDRFNLKVHREKREMPVFGLYLTRPGKTGPQLRPHNPTLSCSAPLPLPAVGTPVATMVGLWPATCGDGTEARTSKYRLREGGRDMTMNAIVDWLTGAGESDRPILDQTGLNGTFDFILEFDPESLGREGISSAPRDDSGPTFTEAIREQLGLQLKKEDGAISIFVVDNVEYPSSN